MLTTRTPAVLLDQQASVLRTQLDGIYDAGVDAIHDARVATRRIRELLALVPTLPGRDGVEDVAGSYKEIGRALGKVRDIDVQIALIGSLETHAPQTAPSLVLVRQDHERDRLSKMRRLIKTLERLDVQQLLSAMSTRHPAGPRMRLTSGAWRQQFRRLVAERARTALESIAHATGVYFPNRVHAVRIAIKKLRYAAEIAEGTSLADLRAPIKELRKGQEILGHLHDRQELSDTLLGYKKDDGVDADHVKLTRHVLEDEVLDLHSNYLGRRAGIRDACAEVERMTTRVFRPTPAIAVGSAIAVSSLVFALTRESRLSRAGAPSSRVLRDTA